MMYHLFQNSIWKVVKIAKTSDITLVGDTYFLPPLYDLETGRRGAKGGQDGGTGVMGNKFSMLAPL